MRVCYYSLFCCSLLYVHSSFAIILMGKRELVVLLGLSSWCLVIVVWSQVCVHVQQQEIYTMRHDMKFPKMWFVQPAKAQTSNLIRAFTSRLTIL